MSTNLSDQDFYKIRPAGRHLLTIGRDLLKDKYAAIVELVKNAYDADSPYCKVSVIPIIKEVEEDGVKGEKNFIKVEIQDGGHGMSKETVINKWMVPSTNDKLLRKISPLGRVMQGRKGVGRYAASVLGDDLLLETVDNSNCLTTLYLIWNDFEKAEYLEDVNILIETKNSSKKMGTNITIIGDENHYKDWNQKQIQNLRFELKKLIPPQIAEFEENRNKDNDFKITLELGNFNFDGQLKFDTPNTVEDIEPYPLFELYDYRISGVISETGMASLKFHNNRSGEPIEIIKEFKIYLNQNPNRRNEQAYCGPLNVDFRVFDRDASSIDGLISRGLKDPTSGQYVGRREARLILDSFNGIGVYRNNFRIRPLGDPGYDWIELDKERVQNPSLKIGSDQIIGFIHIAPEESSILEEKSARDGLKETAAYFGLQEMCKQVLLQLELRRFVYRKNIGLGRGIRKLDEKIDTLYNFSDLKEKINEQLSDANISQTKKDSINKIILEKEKSSNRSSWKPSWTAWPTGISPPPTSPEAGRPGPVIRAEAMQTREPSWLPCLHWKTEQSDVRPSPFHAFRVVSGPASPQLSQFPRAYPPVCIYGYNPRRASGARGIPPRVKRERGARPLQGANPRLPPQRSASTETSGWSRTTRHWAATWCPPGHVRSAWEGDASNLASPETGLSPVRRHALRDGA